MSEKNSIKPLLASVLLEAKNLSHNFDYELFKNINLSLAKKESIAIIGTSGKQANNKGVAEDTHDKAQVRK